MTSDERQFAPAVARNREPILAVLKKHIEPGCTVLETASGSGEHAAFLAPHLSVACWQPSDYDMSALGSIEAWRNHSGEKKRIRQPLALDMTRSSESLTQILITAGAPQCYDAILSINMIHISPWEACQGLMEHAAHLLRPGGVLYLYGPYFQEGMTPEKSNMEFHANLQARNSQWGIRELRDVIHEAHLNGLQHVATQAMPANNLSVLFLRP